MLIGLSGKKQVGKDTLGHYLELRYGFQRIAFADYLKHIAAKLGWDGWKDERGRKLLQDLGLVVRQYNERFWVEAAFRTMHRLQRKGYHDFVITDVRFINEVMLIKEEAGIAIRVWSRDERADDLHPSETELDGFLLWDYKVESIPGDFTGFYRQVDDMLRQERGKATKPLPAG